MAINPQKPTPDTPQYRGRYAKLGEYGLGTDFARQGTLPSYMPQGYVQPRGIQLTANYAQPRYVNLGTNYIPPRYIYLTGQPRNAWIQQQGVQPNIQPNIQPRPLNYAQPGMSYAPQGVTSPSAPAGEVTYGRGVRSDEAIGQTPREKGYRPSELEPVYLPHGGTVYLPPDKEFLESYAKQVGALYGREKGQYTTAVESPGGIWDIINVNYPYWTNPMRIYAYKTLIDSDPYAGAKYPWLDIEGINAAYKFLEWANQGKDPSEWRIPKGSPIEQYLSNLPAPPTEYWFPEEQKQLAEAERQSIDVYKNLQTWQQFLLIASPGANPEALGAPAGAVAASRTINSLVTGLATKGALSLFIPSAVAIGGAPLVTVAGAAVGGMLLYQYITGNEIPYLGNVLQSLSVFNILGEASERVIGLTEQAVQSDDAFREIFSDADAFRAAWQAASMTYETKGTSYLMNLMSKAFGTGEVAKASEGYVWAIDRGEPHPVPLEGGVYGVGALNEARERLLAGEKLDIVYADIASRFGYQGYLGDYIGQAILDPMNGMPYIQNKAMAKIGDSLMKSDTPKILNIETTQQFGAALKVSAETLTGNAIVDFMPWPINSIPQMINRKWRSSGGITQTLMLTQEFYSRGYFPGLTPDKLIPPKNIPEFDKWFAGITNDGFPKYMDVTEPKLNPLKRLTQRTPESKAIEGLHNVVDHVQIELRDVSTADEAYRRVEAMSKADPNQVAGNVAEMTGDLNAEPFTPDSFNSAVAYANALSLREAFAKGIPQADLAMWNATEVQRAKLNEMAKAFDTDVNKVVKMLNDKDADIAGLMRSKNVTIADILPDNEFIRDYFKVYIGDKVAPWSLDLWKSQFISHIYRAADEFLVHRFGLDASQHGKFKRTMQVMKKIQGILVLGFNPRYLIYNWMNNVLSTNVTGVGGIAIGNTPFKIMESYDFFPSAERLGFTEDFSPLKAAAAEKDWKELGRGLIRAQKLVNKIDELSIFKKWSGKMEEIESRSAYAIGFDDAYQSINRVGAGLSEIPDELKRYMTPEEFNKFRTNIESAKKPSDIDKFMEMEDINANNYVRYIAQKLYENSNLPNVDPNFYEGILRRIGIVQMLEEELAGKRTIPEVEEAFNRIRNRVDDTTLDALEYDVSEIRDYVKANLGISGPAAIGMEFSELTYLYAWEWMRQLTEQDQIKYKAMAEAVEGKYLDKNLFKKISDDSNKLHRERMARINRLLGERKAALIESLGGNADRYKNLFDEFASLQEATFKKADSNWEKFSKDVSDRKFKSSLEFDSEYQRVRAENDKLFRELFNAEERYDVELTEMLAQELEAAGQDGQVIREWRAERWEVRKPMIEEINKFFESTIGMSPDDKSIAWNKFVAEVYNPTIQLLAEIDAHYIQNVAPPMANDATAKFEFFTKDVIPMLNDVERAIIDDLKAGRRPWKLSNLPPEAQEAAAKYIAKAKVEMKNNLIAANAFATAMRDFAMLNYQDQTYWDEGLSYIFPYHLWFTKSMRNWAMRAIDKPGMYAQFYRLKRFSSRLSTTGMPERLKDKIRIPWPWLEDWMGTGIWINPLSQLFPPSQFIEAGQRLISFDEEIKRDAEYILNDLVKEGKITKYEAEQARATRSGRAWDLAYSIAQKESDMSDPMNIVSMMMQPAMWVTVPYYLLKGKPEKIQPTPLLRTSRTLSEMLGGEETFFGKVAGFPAGIAGAIRQGLGMSRAQAFFGEWGDYLVERNIANMLEEGLIDYEQMMNAIINKEGAVYEEGWNRTMQEVSLREPFYLTKLAAENGAPMDDITWSAFISVFPAGILPEGEISYRNHKQEYAKAWEIYKKGDKRPLAEFYDKHPEYSARSAINIKDPEERVRQYLISAIWNRYTALPSPDRTAINNELGPYFETAFLDSKTAAPENIDLETLQQWLYVIGGQPTGEYQQKFEEAGIQPMTYWPKEMTDEYKKFQDERDKKFPNWFAIQQGYYSLTSKSERRKYLQKFPELRKYWEWKADYERKHPAVQPIFTANRQAGQGGLKGYLNEQEYSMISEPLYDLLYQHIIAGYELPPGAYAALYDMWNKLGNPGGIFDTWFNYELIPAVKATLR